MTDAAPRPRRRAAGPLAAGAVALALVLAGCAGTPDPVDATVAPSDATSQDFCAAYDLGLGEDNPTDAPVETLVDALRASGVALADAGTPDDVPEPARAGFEVYAAAISAVSADQVRALRTADTPRTRARALGLGAGDAARYRAFARYVAATCFTPLP
ncbi:MAG: hypothetical protein CMH83_23130 [Nocardioides sp.]|nr:hypothetical protein [Nocardioides sp.]